MGKAFPNIACAVTLMVVSSVRGGKLSAANAFGALAVFQTIRIGMIMLPMSILLANTMLESLRRMGEVLVAPESPRPAPVAASDPSAIRFAGAAVVLGGDGAAEAAEVASTADEPAKDEAATTGEAATADEAKPLAAASHVFRLELGDLEIRRGGVTAVVGGVGSGKSTLVAAALGRAPLAEGTVTTDASVGYAPQEVFVASGTVLENVLLGRPFDEKAFAKAVAVASLGRDLELLPQGRETVLGERGATLSGGQQHRLNVARAVYFRRAELPKTGRGAAAAATWMFRGDQSHASGTAIRSCFCSTRRWRPWTPPWREPCSTRSSPGAATTRRGRSCAAASVF